MSKRYPKGSHLAVMFSFVNEKTGAEIDRYITYFNSLKEKEEYLNGERIFTNSILKKYYTATDTTERRMLANDLNAARFDYAQRICEKETEKY